jgi:hypothetical protein
MLMAGNAMARLGPHSVGTWLDSSSTTCRALCCYCAEDANVYRNRERKIEL